MSRKRVTTEQLAAIITETIRRHRLGGEGLAVTSAKVLRFHEPMPDDSNWSCLLARPTESVPVEAIQEIWSEVMPELHDKYKLEDSKR
ncbi:MAG TPA: hypothetical protein VLK65_29755 [Vicinamibacteria bacterium]|nr:hypothetical protein [Vicinamibacteria bacterium]